MRDAAAKFRQDPMSRDLEIRVSLLAPFALGTFQCLADITIGALSARSATPIFFVAATVKSSEKGGTGKGGVSRNLWRGYQCGIRRKERNIKRPRERMSNGIRGVSAREEEKKKEKERSVDEVGKVRKARTNREREREKREKSYQAGRNRRHFVLFHSACAGTFSICIVDDPVGDNKETP